MSIENRIARLSLETLRALSLLDDSCQPAIGELVAMNERGEVSPMVARSYAIGGYLDDAKENALAWWDYVTVNRQLW
jgi:hypothetical protein